jgi:hypothetical protein
MQGRCAAPWHRGQQAGPVVDACNGARRAPPTAGKAGHRRSVASCCAARSPASSLTRRKLRKGDAVARKGKLRAWKHLPTSRGDGEWTSRHPFMNARRLPHRVAKHGARLWDRLSARTHESQDSFDVDAGLRRRCDQAHLLRPQFRQPRVNLRDACGPLRPAVRTGILPG